MLNELMDLTSVPKQKLINLHWQSFQFNKSLWQLETKFWPFTDFAKN